MAIGTTNRGSGWRLTSCFLWKTDLAKLPGERTPRRPPGPQRTPMNGKAHFAPAPVFDKSQFRAIQAMPPDFNFLFADFERSAGFRRAQTLNVSGMSPAHSGAEDSKPHRRAATIGAFTGSAAAGMVVTRAPVDDGACGVAAAAGCAGPCVSPIVLRTSASNFAITSLLSFRNWRAFSRPCPMRSPL